MSHPVMRESRFLEVNDVKDVWTCQNQSSPATFAVPLQLKTILKVARLEYRLFQRHVRFENCMYVYFSKPRFQS